MKAPSLFGQQTAPSRNPRVRLGVPLLFDPEAQALQEMNQAPLAEASVDPAETLPPEKLVAAPNRNLGPIQPPTRPVLQAPPLRDVAGEGRRGTQAGLMALAFGAGLGRGTAPALGAVALRGTSQGAEQAFQNQARQVDAQNKLAASQFDLAQDQFRMQETDANRRGDELHRSDMLELQKAKARADYFSSLDGLDPESLQAKLTRDFDGGVHQALQIEGIPRDKATGRWDVSAVVTERQAAQKALDDSRRTDDRRQLIMSLSQLTPEGRRAAVAALGQSGDLAALGFNVTQGEDGAYQLDGVNLDELGKAPTGAWSPGAVAARGEQDRQRAYQKHGEDAQELLQRFANSGRVSGAVRSELLDRVRVIGEALRAGKQIPAYVFELQPDSVASMEPALRERLDLAREGLGLRRDQAAETKRHNYATEAAALQRLKTQTDKAGAPSARFQAAQSEYAQLRTYYTALMHGDVPTVDKQAHGEAVKNVLRRLGELESKYPAFGHGWSAGDSPTGGSPRKVQSGGRTLEIRKK